MYKITATILKPGGLPVEWTCVSKERLTSTQCEKKFSQVKEAGKTAEERVLVKNFKCVSVPRKWQVSAGCDVSSAMERLSTLLLQVR